MPEGAARLHVQRGGRLVEHQQLGVAGQCHREADPLGLPAGQPVHPPPGELPEAGQLQGLGDVHGVRVGGRDEGDQLTDGDPRYGLAVLQHGAHPAGPHRRLRRAAEQRHRALVGRQQPQQHREGGGLPRAVAPEECHRLARRDRQLQTVHGPHRAIVPRHPGELHGRDARCRGCSPCCSCHARPASLCPVRHYGESPAARQRRMWTIAPDKCHGRARLPWAGLAAASVSGRIREPSVPDKSSEVRSSSCRTDRLYMRAIG